MSRVAYVNGRYVPRAHALVHVEDRGYQFADGVYEVIAVRGGGLVDEAPHMDRLDRSLAALGIAPPMSRAALGVVIREVARRNRVIDGIVYLQVTRGVAPRDHAFPAEAQSALVVTARQRARRADAGNGVAVITIPDIRWKRCDIKTVSLVANVLGRQQAVEAGAYEAWQVDAEGFITEGTASNAWIVTPADELVTRNTDHAILDGITRLAVRRLAGDNGVRPVERAFTVAEAKAAREAFLTSTTSEVLPVVRIDDTPVANGEPGTLTRRLVALYAGHINGG